MTTLTRGARLSPDTHQRYREPEVRILFLSHQYPPETNFGGIASYTALMSQALSTRGHEVHVLTCWENQMRVDRLEGNVHVHRRRNVHVPGLRRFLRLPGVRHAASVVQTPREQYSANPLFRFKTAATCYREYKRLGLEFDVVESPDWMAESLVFGLRREVPLVVDLKGNLLLYTRYSGWDLTWHGRLSNAVERQAVGRATIVTSPSRLTSDELAEAGWANTSTARIIRRPVDVSRWTASSAATNPVILQVGRIEALKAPDVVLRAAARLLPVVPDVEVVFIGSPYGLIDGQPPIRRVEQLAAELGVRCRVVGQAQWDEVKAWYERARVVTAVSLYDNFPNVGLEAMASGRPVVCSTRTGLAELASEVNGGIGVAEPGSVQALADGVAPYLTDQQYAVEAGNAARDYVERCSTPDVIAAQREAVYLEAIRSSSNA
jgi:glycosyltransferase involved in cell wall biosynthesis